MSYIIKAGSGCNGASCRECERYLSGFFSRDGGITVRDDTEDAEMAACACPQQIIEIEEYRGDKSK